MTPDLVFLLAFLAFVIVIVGDVILYWRLLERIERIERRLELTLCTNLVTSSRVPPP